ncbi:DUF1997 domain-containing protein [Halothece sp. PCC 7418]|uniref:DUF1997 domain-containing protein n=1 Tax=Halothece sp. (strain PCC 7418) TaxID=65093 RepID=UPI001C0A8EF1|nr:DUF1997 domain-containing protein [Halothece sp. PCC 7418]
MTMHSDAETVKRYLDAHQGWFVRCAQPMAAEPIGENSYALTIGRFGALGFQVEPKLGVELLPEAEGIYRMETVPLETSDTHFYSVDYQAELQLIENSNTQSSNLSLPRTVVEWTLDLGVTIHFPRFIYRFSKPMVQKTGDRLLNQIVRQVSRRLTYKVQVDFHTRYDLPLPS